jgi:hypothetical protein
VLYGSETWVLSKREENKWLVFERKVFERYGVRKSKMVSTRGGTITSSIKSLPARMPQNETKTSRLRYAGHMIRRPEDLPQKVLFRAKPNGRRKQRRPKSRWADGMG